MQNYTTANSQEMNNELVFYDDSAGRGVGWEDLLKEFGKEKGIPVKYVSGQAPIYEEGLGAALAGENPPTIMKIHSAMVQKLSALHCMYEPLDDTKAASELLGKKFATISDDGHIIGLTYYAEIMGYLYNKNIVKKYFGLKDRDHTVDSMEDIDNQTKLIGFVEDLDKHKSELGIEGVFPTCAFVNNDDTQWKSFVMTPPMYFEMMEKGLNKLETFDFKYRDSSKRMYDMIFKHSIGTPDDYAETRFPVSAKQFMTGKAAMIYYINGLRITYIRRNKLTTPEQLEGVLTNDEIGILPIYFDVDCDTSRIRPDYIGYAWSFAVNKYAPEEKKKLAKEFIDWVLLSKKGRSIMKSMHYQLPYRSVSKDEGPDDPFMLKVYDIIHDESKVSPYFAHAVMPSGAFRAAYAANLLKYAKGEMTWENVCEELTSKWPEGMKKNTENMEGFFAGVLSKEDK